MTRPSLPKKGMSREAVLDRLQTHRQEDVDWRGGRTFSLVYYAGEQVMQVLHDAYTMTGKDKSIVKGNLAQVWKLRGGAWQLVIDVWNELPAEKK